MRVYALAKQLGMENRDLIPELKRMGITVASHSSALDDDVVQKVLEKLGPKLKAHGKTTDRATEADTGRGERTKIGMVSSDHAAGARAGSSQATSSVEESSKLDKRRILIKRKRADDIPTEEAAPLPSVESMGTGGAEALVASPAAPAYPQVETPTAAQIDLTATPDQLHAMGGTIATAPTSIIKPAVAPSPDAIVGKKKALSLEEMQAEGLREKAKKVRKPGRTREEEELRL
ncbi:MAG TPA: translation initiation factor IF-2 N-terminal domain-containing protein, partial [Nitrospiraceae bacterium]